MQIISVVTKEEESQPPEVVCELCSTPVSPKGSATPPEKLY